MPAIAPVPCRDRVALSFAQQRLWVLDQFMPGSAEYLVVRVLRLAGQLDVAALEKALAEIVARHEALRTRFEVTDGDPVQVIEPPAGLKLPVADLSGLAGEQAQAQMATLVAAQGAQPFDLAAAPLLRAQLLRLPAGEHVLIVVMHHIAADGWSVGVLTQELGTLYAAFSQGQPSPLEPLPIQYADFAVRQREWMHGAALDRQLAYWHQQLDGLTPLELPADHPRPPVRTARGGVHRFVLPAPLRDSLAQLSRCEGVTLFMTLLAAFQVQLSRYTSQPDIAVGTPIANRNRPETEGLIGFFVNTLVMRADLSSDPTFRQLLAQVRETALGAYTHQDLPFERLVEELHPKRDLSRTPLFQVMFAFQNTPATPLQLPGITITTIDPDQPVSKFDLTLSVTEHHQQLHCRIEYNTDLFHPATITRMAGHYHTLLEAATTNPAQPTSQLPMLTEPEQRQLAKWNDTAAPYPRARCVHEMFEEQAARTPGATAVVFEDAKLSYNELNQQANQLAHYLRDQGAGPDTLIAICAERSLEMVVALLAILKAGAAYVPLDPTYPAPRLRYILADTQASLLITQHHLHDRLAAQTPAICLDLKPDQRAIATRPATNPPPLAQPANLAYVIYTSGSTGKPKGVAVAHAGVINLLTWMQGEHRLRADDRVLQKAPFTFDVSVWEFFLPLATGACLVVAKPEGHRDPLYLANLIQRELVTTIHFTPSMLRAFIAAQETSRCATLRRVFCGGAVLSPRLQQRLNDHLSVPLYNLYGPTETTVDVTFWRCQRAASSSVVPIGGPIANTQVHVLDRVLNPVPAGVPGEVYLGGAGLARGYLGRGRLTAERFVANPFGVAGSRLYRTGDLGRFREDGTVEFLGRVDDQVKIRGYRVEPGEVESALLGHAEVAEAVVTARDDFRGDRRLVAYVVPVPGTAPTVAGLRAFLGLGLPEYMIPAACVVVPALPRNANGKVDRAALPQPDPGRPELEEAFVAPRSPLEEMIAEIWSGVLGIGEVGVRDNFFDLGGHSLLATQVMSRLGEVLGVTIPLRRLFEAPTVAGLAEVVGAGEGLEPGMPAIAPVPCRDRVALSFAQQRLWVLDQFMPGSAEYLVVRVLRLAGQLDVAALEKALAEIVARHEALRTRFEVTDGDPVQVIEPPAGLKLPVADLSGLAGEQAQAQMATLVAAQGAQPFDLAAAPLLRAQLLRLPAGEHVLIVVMHHIAADGWSVGVLTQELGTLYAAFSQGQPSPLEPLPIQYADFAVRQREWMHGAALDRQLAYWHQQLDGLTPLELPADHPRPPVRTARGGVHRFVLPAPLRDSLAQLSRCEGVTLFMTLLAAFQVQLSRYTSQPDIAVGTPIANRNRPETEGLIGFFVNTLVMRADLSSDPTFRQLLAQVRETALGAYTHQDLPFERLVEELHPKRDLSRTPLFQVMFAFQNTPATPLQLPGITITTIDPDQPVSKFDLTLSVTEHHQQLHCRIEYNTDLFHPATITRMAGHYHTLLEAATTNPAQPTSQLPMLTEPEQRQLAKWNDTAAPYPRARCVHEMFEEQAARTPGATAVVFEDAKLSYNELNQQANQLAHYLRDQGAGPDTLIAICAERSLEMVVALLAILKAGAAYVPLDPTYPAPRLRYILADTQASLLITQHHLHDRLAAQTPAICLDLKPDQRAIATRPATNPPPLAQPANLAYVIYTSGSTGKPKGVGMPHAGLTNLLIWHATELSVRNTVLQFASLGFDASFHEIFAALCYGGKLIVVSDEVRRDPVDLAASLLRHRVAKLIVTPLVLEAIAREFQDNYKGLMIKELISTGDALRTTKGIKQFLRSLDGCTLINHYGPSETHVVTSLSFPPAVESWPDGTNIGGPIANTQVHVLDRVLNPVPAGVPGEVYLGGAGLARGYLGRGRLTAERFVANPFGVAGSRLYRTGDLGRFREDGTVEFLGRVDDQVKIRGYRVEPGEVESALLGHAEVAEAVVTARDDFRGDRRLVAYVVPVPGTAPTVAGLRAFLGLGLPEYMIPAACVVVPALPRNANGKVDRAALPQPDPGRPELEEAFVAPRSPLEEMIAEIWSGVLGIGEVGVRDNFFDLGGHSLLATQVMSRLGEVLGVTIPLRRLFEAPTVAGLAEVVGAGEGLEPGMPAIAPVPCRDRVALSFAQQRLWVLDQFMPGSAEYLVVRVLRLAGQLDVAALEKALAEIVARHEALRTRFEVTDGDPVQVIEPPAGLKLPVADLSGLAGEQAQAQMATLVAAQGAQPFDLAAAPLLRAQLLRLPAGEHVLIVVMHHIAADGWSVGVLTQELGTLYAAFSQGQPSPLEPLPIQYADFAVRQREWMHGAALDRQLAYWHQQLDGLTPLELPADHPRPPVRTARGGVHRFVLPAPLRDSLAQLSRCEGVTLFMTLLAAFQVQLSRYTSQPDIAVGTPIANRNRPETEGLIGFFVNTLVMRADLSSDPTFRQLLAQVRETALGAYTHQDLPFERLVEELHPKRDLSRTPLFQVMFAFQNTPATPLQLPGITITTIDPDQPVSKFDLTLSVTEHHQQLHCRIEYNTDLFHPATITRMAGHYHTLLEAATTNPAQPTSQLPMNDVVTGTPPPSIDG